MLLSLRVCQIALVDEVEIPFVGGLNILTGETGAGKSILVNALLLVLGGRASSELVREGADAATVEALFDVKQGTRLARNLRELGFEDVDDEMIVRRTISATGKNRVTVNGQLVTLGMLARLLSGVVDITGQHENVSLLDPNEHLELLDAFCELGALRRELAQIYGQVSGYRAALEDFNNEQRDKLRREDYLRHVVQEIDEVAPRTDELAELEVEIERLRHAETLSSATLRAEALLYSDERAVVETLGRAQQELSRLVGLDRQLAEPLEMMEGLLAQLDELVRNLRLYNKQMRPDPQRLEQLSERREQIRRLIRKHGANVEDVLNVRDAFRAELDDLEHQEARVADLHAALQAEEQELNRCAKMLSAQRRQGAVRLTAMLTAELRELSMPHVRAEIVFENLPTVGVKGAEQVEIQMSTNPGEAVRPLRKVASGGELSRILLAVKQVLAEQENVASFVFDEIDSGIGGATAEVLGKKLKHVAKQAQVICVTHLAQVAAYADSHLYVEKAVTAGRTVTKVCVLTEKERVGEVARMLGGLKISPKTRAVAQELLSRGSGPLRETA